MTKKKISFREIQKYLRKNDFVLLKKNRENLKNTSFEILSRTLLSSLIIVSIFLPLFLYNRWKDKNIQDYTLTKENFERMKNIKKKKKVQ